MCKGGGASEEGRQVEYKESRKWRKQLMELIKTIDVQNEARFENASPCNGYRDRYTADRRPPVQSAGVARESKAW